MQYLPNLIPKIDIINLTCTQKMMNDKIAILRRSPYTMFLYEPLRDRNFHSQLEFDKHGSNETKIKFLNFVSGVIFYPS